MPHTFKYPHTLNLIFIADHYEIEEIERSVSDSEYRAGFCNIKYIESQALTRTYHWKPL